MRAAASVPPLVVRSRRPVRVSCSPARDEQGPARVVHEITTARGRSLAVPTDVGDPAAVERLVQRMLDAFGRLDAAFITRLAAGMARVRSGLQSQIR